MANKFELRQEMIRDAAIILSENLVAANLCNREIEDKFAENIGDEVSVKMVPDLGEAKEFDGVETVPTDVIEQKTKVKLEKHFYQRVNLTSKQMSLEVDDFIVQVINPMVLSLARSVDKYLIAKWAGGFARNLVGSDGTSPTTEAHIIAARKKIIDNNAPYRNVAAIIDTTAEAAFLQLTKFTSVDYGAERPAALREGVLGKLHGATFFTSQNANTSFDRGDIAGTVLVNGASQTGSTINVDGFTAATGTVKAGTRATFAGATGTYTVIEDCAIAGNAAALKLDRAVDASPTNDGAVTFATAFKQDLLYNIRAASGAVIAPAPLMGGVQGGVDTYNGLSIRVGMQGSLGSLSNTIVTDVFVGGQVLYPAAGTVFQG
jgi:hypothetical protein